MPERGMPPTTTTSSIVTGTTPSQHLPSLAPRFLNPHLRVPFTVLVSPLMPTAALVSLLVPTAALVSLVVPTAALVSALVPTAALEWQAVTERAESATCIESRWKVKVTLP